ncbi:methyltransferase, partial [Streptomyces rubellomurinus subsp. indigoferus]
RRDDATRTSLEYHPQVAQRAAAALQAAGDSRRLLVGDGLAGEADGGAFDRLNATCSVRYRPRAGVLRVQPGGRVLATLSGGHYANAVALLDVTDPGEATGGLLPRYTSFLMARPHHRPP